MADLNRIVVHSRDGKLLKGTTQDFFPNRPLFHVQPADDGESVEVRCKTLKSAFFVKDFAGDARRQDALGFLAAPGETKQGRKIAVRFKDGELLTGYSLTYSADREGFFMFPSDARSNNLRIYVLVGATAEVKSGLDADELVKRTLDQRKGGDAAA